MTDAPANNDSGNADNQPTQDDLEWNNAQDELLSSKGIENSNDDKGGQNAGNQDDSNKGDDKGTDADAGAGNDGDKGAKGTGTSEDDDDTSQNNNEEDAYDPTIANARKTQREIQEDRKTYVTELREKMYPDLKTELTDSEGNPIRTTADLMKLENPVTGKAFTEEQAALFLMKAKSHLAEQNEKAENRVNEVADVLISVRDEALAVKHKWGPLLKELEKTKPGISDRLLADYKKTLRVDPESGIIVDNPLSAEDYYNNVLSGYEEARKALQTGEQQHQQDQEEVKKAQTAAEKARNKRDRGDVTGGNNTDTRDKDAKEWDAAEQEVFGDRLNKNKK